MTRSSTKRCGAPLLMLETLQMFDRTLVVGPFQCNCRLLACPRTGDAVLVDPGDEPQKILKALQGARIPSAAGDGPLLRVKYLFHTHGHLDHIGATRPVCEAVTAASGERPQIALHRGDEELYRKLSYQRSLFGIPHDPNRDEPLPVDHYLNDEEEIRVGDLRFSVLHTPGHSPGSVCLRLHEDSAVGVGETVFSGDTLFQGSVGRTDLFGGDSDQMFRSIRQRILTLDDDTRVCPGHGPETRIGTEKRGNPFL